MLRQVATGFEHLQLRRSPGRYMAGVWSLVRGGIEQGETAQQAALREMREETGLAPLPGQYYRLGTVETFYTSEHDGIWMCPFFVAFVADDAMVTLNPEHTDFRWVPDARMDDALTFPNEHLLLGDVRRYFCRHDPHPSLGLMRLEVKW